MNRHPNPFQPREPSWSFDGINAALHSISLPQQRIAETRPWMTASRVNASPTGPSSDMTRQNPLHASQENTPPTRLDLVGRGDVAGAYPPPIGYTLGTREEVQADDYVSPLTNMYNRAWNRYREAEVQRAAIRESNDVGRAQPDTLSNWPSLLGTHPPENPDLAREFTDNMNSLRRESARALRERTVRLRLEVASNPFTSRESVNPIDHQPSRPPPLSADEMTANIGCRICQEQKVDTLLEPCMHIAICHWCYDVMLDRVRRYHRGDREGGEARLRCPMCRFKVKQGRKIYLAV